jgi:hypothetical protein
LSTVADYVGRTVDFLVFRANPALRRNGAQLLVQQVARTGDGGAIVTGIEKLAQRVLLILLTQLGSKPYAPTEGTSFMIDAKRGAWRTPADVTSSFYAASLDVKRQQQAIETSDDPDDERWGGIVLDGVTLADSTVAIRLTLTSQAGTAFTFITPITVPIR